MSTESISLPRSDRASGRSRAFSLPHPAPELAGLLVLAAVLYLWALDRNGFANEYYSAAVRSMSDQLARVPLRLVRRGGRDDGRQAAARAVGRRRCRSRVFGFSSWSMLVPQALMGVATVGADLRPHAPALRPRGRLRRRAGARAHADHGRDRAPQQPGRAARALLHRRAVVRRARARGRAHALARARRRGRRPRLRGEDGGRAAGGPGDRRRVAVGRAARPWRRPSSSCSPAARRWSRSASPGRC